MDTKSGLLKIHKLDEILILDILDTKNSTPDNCVKGHGKDTQIRSVNWFVGFIISPKIFFFVS